MSKELTVDLREVNLIANGCDSYSRMFPKVFWEVCKMNDSIAFLGFFFDGHGQSTILMDEQEVMQALLSKEFRYEVFERMLCVTDNDISES